MSDNSSTIEAAFLVPDILQPVKVTGSNPQQGLVLSHTTRHPPLLVTDWDGAAFAIYLGSEHAFKFFELKLDISVRGLLLAKVQLAVDISSHYDPLRDDDPPGAVVLRDGIVHIVGTRMNESWSDSVLVPLWLKCGIASPDEAVGFKRWTLFIEQNNERVLLWKHQR